MIETKVKFPSLLKRLEVEASPAGEPIYEWEYLDESGEIQKDKSNFQEMIQSYERQALGWKARIEKGEEVNDTSGLYMDISQLGDNPTDIHKYLSSLAERLRQDIEKTTTEQSKKIEPPVATSGEITLKNREDTTKGDETK